MPSPSVRVRRRLRAVAPRGRRGPSAIGPERGRLSEDLERRLVRFGLDLHDGPAQDVAGLLGDLRLFRSQLESGLGDSSRLIPLSGRVDDLEARVLSLEASIRELALNASRPALLQVPIGELLRGEARAFARATGIRPELRISGPLNRASASQRIALLRVIQESLCNVRKHARARSVSISVEALPGRIEAEIADDGRGFEVERALSLAARRDRLGLAGVIERARLLGGRCEVSSRPGGPTRVSVILPR